MEPLDYARPMPSDRPRRQPPPPEAYAWTLLVLATLNWLIVWAQLHHRQYPTVPLGVFVALAFGTAWQTYRVPRGPQRTLLLVVATGPVLLLGVSVVECPHETALYVGPIRAYSTGVSCRNDVPLQLWWYYLL